MWLFVWTNEPSKIFVGDTPISKVFLWDTQVRPSWHATESIEYKMNADSSGNLYVPVGWYNESPISRNAVYDWNISVDWWQSTNYSWTWSAWWSITLSWYTAWSSHTIKITPTNATNWWALAYWRTDTAWAPYLTDILYDGSYIGYGGGATSVNHYFRYSQYKWCTALTAAAKEVLPDWITVMGSYFRYAQYEWCTSLTTAAKEVLPNTLTNIQADFRANQYSWCTSLTTTAVEVLPSSVTSMLSDFRSWQYSWCTSLRAAAVEVLPTTVTDIGAHFRSWQYRWCTSLTVAANEVLPSSVTSIWSSFRANQYRECTSLTTIPVEVLPDTVTSIWNYFRGYQYRWCTALTTISWWKDLSIGGKNYRRQQFYQSTASKTVKVLSDVWYASYDSDTLANSYVTTVSVPSAYLSNFTWASIEPWVSIDDNKFIGY